MTGSERERNGRCKGTWQYLWSTWSLFTTLGDDRPSGIKYNPCGLSGHVMNAKKMKQFICLFKDSQTWDTHTHSALHTVKWMRFYWVNKQNRLTLTGQAACIHRRGWRLIWWACCHQMSPEYENLTRRWLLLGLPAIPFPTWYDSMLLPFSVLKHCLLSWGVVGSAMLNLIINVYEWIDCICRFLPF